MIFVIVSSYIYHEWCYKSIKSLKIDQSVCLKLKQQKSPKSDQIISYNINKPSIRLQVYSPGQPGRAPPVPHSSQPAERCPWCPDPAEHSSVMLQQQVTAVLLESGSHTHTWRPACRCAAAGWRAAPPQSHRCLQLLSAPPRRGNVGRSPAESLLLCPSGGWRGWPAPSPGGGKICVVGSDFVMVKLGVILL